MRQFPRSSDAFGFTIEVHSGGRRVWPPSFKRYITSKLDSGELTVDQVMKACEASRSLVYKWRADVKYSKIRSVAVCEEGLFSEVLVEEEAPSTNDHEDAGNRILLTGRETALSLPAAYPVEELVRIILALEGRA